MKKIFLLLLLVTYSFSIDGFDKLKWESSPEDFYKYYNNYNYYTSDNSYFTLIDPDIYFEGEKLQRVDLFYNNLKLVQWIGITDTSKENALRIYNKYKDKYQSGEENITDNRKSFIYFNPTPEEFNTLYIVLKEYNTYSSIYYSFFRTVK